jgi:hypothetical protein
MAEKKAAATHDLVVLGRSGYGQDWNPLFSVNDAHQAAQEHRPNKRTDTAFTTNTVELFKGKKLVLTIDEAKALCIDYIRSHRSGGDRTEYRIKDRATGAILAD